MEQPERPKHPEQERRYGTVTREEWVLALKAAPTYKGFFALACLIPLAPPCFRIKNLTPGSENTS